MTSISMHDGRVALHQADCRDVLRSLADNSIDSIVTDPPYALVSIQKRFGKPGSAPAKDVYGRGAAGFMGKQWDTGEVAFSEEFWAECLRVLKPGGHVVAFSGTRTYHRMAVAIEDAGFEIRDQLGWLYGSGFPKSHNQHDEWEGWGTALKPAWEPIALARKPLGVPKDNQLIEGESGEMIVSPVVLMRPCTVAENLAHWGVGALNIDGCRVGVSGARNNGRQAGTNGIYGEIGATTPVDYGKGRWPANIIHDGSDEVLAAFPDAPGQQGYVGPEHGKRPSKGIYGDFGARPDSHPRADQSKSAARFFYCAKASRKDRDEGLLPVGGSRANTHPTVKPTTLMRWLCRLVTPPGGVILDPFMGSGSTGKAALLEGFRFIGCEREDEYMPIAEARIRAALRRADNDNQPVAAPAAVAANSNQSDLFARAA